MSSEAQRVNAEPAPYDNDNTLPEAHKESLRSSLPMIKMWALGAGNVEDIAVTLGNLEMKGITAENNELAGALSAYAKALKANEGVGQLHPTTPDLHMYQGAAAEGLAQTQTNLKGVVERYDSLLR